MALSLACPGDVVPGESDRQTTGVVLDLAADLPFAWAARETTRVRPGRARDARRFTNGWLEPQPDPEQPGGGFVWSTGRTASVELSIAEPAARLLAIDLAPYRAPEQLPVQIVRLRFNGRDLGSYELPWERSRLEVPVPSEIQRPGLNRLELAPRHWIRPSAGALGDERQRLGVKLYGIDVTAPGQASDPGRPMPRVEQGVLVQPPGSVVSWHYIVPAGARLRGVLRARAGPGGADPSWTLSAIDARGDPVSSSTRSLADVAAAASGVEVDLDLSDHAGEILSIRSAVTSGPPSARLQWSEARIEGEVPAPPAVPSSSTERPHVLVILFDTLRADGISVYGNDAVQTPSLERLAASGFTFSNTFANASWTKASIASLWTGLRPTSHGLVRLDSSLPKKVAHLPELMKAAGYYTLGVSANAFFSRQFGFDRGMDVLHPYYSERQEILAKLPAPESQAEAVWTRFLAPAFETAGGRPVFAIVHELDPHMPYDPPPPYDRLYDFGYRGNLDSWSMGPLADQLRMLDAVNRFGAWLDAADVRAMRSRYQGEISAMDAYLGWILDALEREGLRERTLIVFLSDHGEQFFEHGAWGHGASVHDEEIRVPLIFSLPGIVPAGRRSAAHAQGVDVLPTILDLVGVPKPGGLHGRTLVPDILSAESSAEPRVTFARSNLGLLDKQLPAERSLLQDSVRWGDWKLARSSLTQKGRERVEYELFDLEQDAGETLDPWAAEPVLGHALRQLLERRIALDGDERVGTAGPVDLEPEVLENLRGLGYVE